MTTTVTVGGLGDIINPSSWVDAANNSPPTQFSQVPYNVNYPLNGDGRYWFSVSSFSPISTFSPIKFVGGLTYLSTGSVNLQWSVVQAASDGSTPYLAYMTSATWTTIALSSAGAQLGGIQNGNVVVPLNTLSTLSLLRVQVFASGGTSLATATPYQVALAITRNNTEGLTWDSPNAFDPVNYNALASDNNIPTATLLALRTRLLVRLGFANQSTNPQPGMATLIQDFLTSAQTYLYKRYVQLHTKRLFRWQVNPGQRFYSLKDNDENVLERLMMDPNKKIEWAGIQDSRNVWYPLIEGIDAQLYTMITKPWRPARYELKGAIELYPMPDQTYWLWVKGHFGLMSFVNLTDTSTIDAELIFLQALANAKAHYGQPDAQVAGKQADDYRKELIAASHQTGHYIPGTVQVPPAVRPTLIGFSP